MTLKLADAASGRAHVFSEARSSLSCLTAEEWGIPVYIQSVRKKVPLRDLSLNLASHAVVRTPHFPAESLRDAYG